MFADASKALLPTVKEATEAGILVTVHNGTYVGGEAGKDFVTSIAEDICKLGTDFIKAVADNTADRPASSSSAARRAIRSAPPGRAAPTKEVANHAGSSSSARPTPTGRRKAASRRCRACSPSTTTSAPMSTNMPTVSAARSAPTRRPARSRTIVVALRTDEQGLFCDWEKANDPDFKIFYSSGQNFQSRIALTAAMMKKAGKDVDAEHQRALLDEAGGQGHVQSRPAARGVGVDPDRQRHAEGDVRQVETASRPHHRGRARHCRCPASLTQEPARMSVVALKLSNVSKTYPGVRALSDMSFECLAGEIHAVLGENGSGKSTLLGIASGAVTPDGGVIEIMGKPLTAADPLHGARARPRHRLPGRFAGARADGRAEPVARRGRRRIAYGAHERLGREAARRLRSRPRARRAGRRPDAGRAAVPRDRQGADREAEGAAARRADIDARPRRRQEAHRHRPQARRRRHRDRLCQPPPAGDSRPRRPRHHPARRHRPRHLRDQRGAFGEGPDRADGRPLDRGRVSAKARPRKPTRRCCRSPASPAAISATCPFRCSAARSSASPAPRATASATPSARSAGCRMLRRRRLQRQAGPHAARRAMPSTAACCSSAPTARRSRSSPSSACART